jgi:hypothetical protein
MEDLTDLGPDSIRLGALIGCDLFGRLPVWACIDIIMFAREHAASLASSSHCAPLGGRSLSL